MLHQAFLSTILPALLATGLGGCYILPMTPDGRPTYVVAADGTFTPNVVASDRAAHLVAAAPATLVARMYPANDLAAKAGVITGMVTNRLDGKGEFRFDLGGETMVGEATRVNGDLQRGVASGYGSRGTYMKCEYRLTSATLGSGSCSLSNGAMYQLHFGR
jgi:hypothetical protein